MGTHKIGTMKEAQQVTNTKGNPPSGRNKHMHRKKGKPTDTTPLNCKGGKDGEPGPEPNATQGTPRRRGTIHRDMKEAEEDPRPFRRTASTSNERKNTR